MNPENRKAPNLSTLKRQNGAISRAVKRQEKVLMALAEQRVLLTQLQDLRDFNAGRIDGKPEDYSPKLKAEAERRRKLEDERLGPRY